MSRGMAIVEGLTILFIMQFSGEFLSRVIKLPLPGNLIGLILLFILLTTGIIKVEKVEEAANLLLDNMMLLFIPINVGLITILPLLRKEGLAIILSILISTILVMLVTAKTIEFIKRGKGVDSESNADAN